jgi:hypothetical protein
MGLLYGRAGRLTALVVDFRPRAVNAIKFAVNHTLCTMEDFPCLAPEWQGNGTQCDLWEGSPCSAKVRHYMIQPLVELHGGCMVVLKVSWCGIRSRAR